MKVKLNSSQTSFIVDITQYTLDEFEVLIGYPEILQCNYEFRVYTPDVDKISIVIDKYGNYANQITTKSGKKIYVKL